VSEHRVVIAIKPRPKGRPRYARGRMYTPTATQEFEAAVRAAWVSSVGPTFEGPVEVELAFGAETVTVTVRALDGDVKSPLRGDLDNYVKSTLDGLNTVAFDDDRRVMRLRASKA
jgi:Holliday junction resolvase RusA-like endonuclease